MGPWIKEPVRWVARQCCRYRLLVGSNPLPMSDHEPILVLAPHVDDEALGCGEFLIRRAAAGQICHVAYFTDSSGTGRTQPRAVLAAQRKQEAIHAMGAIGIPLPHLHFLDAPDGRLKDFTDTERHHWEAVIVSLLTALQPRLLLLPCHFDGSSEHEAMYRLVSAAMSRITMRPRVLEFPVWSWWNPRFLWPHIGRISHVWHQPITRHGTDKRALIECYPSQTAIIAPAREPVLSRFMIQAFLQGHEFFFEMESNS